MEDEDNVLSDSCNKHLDEHGDAEFSMFTGVFDTQEKMCPQPTALEPIIHPHHKGFSPQLLPPCPVVRESSLSFSASK